MRIDELKRKKKVETVFDPVEGARTTLEWLKESGETLRPNGTLQLFVPRKFERYATKKERSDYILRDRARYAYDDEGELDPQLKKWIDQATESINYKLDESVPVIAGSPILPGDSKPVGATLWTSTARQLSNGLWTSDWNKFVMDGGTGSKGTKNQSKIGYLYKVRPRTCVLEIDGSHDAKMIYDIFAKLGRENTALANPEEWNKIREYGFGNEISIIKKDFPWQHIARHFDCVHHWSFSSGSRDSDSNFTYGWDIESTAFFKPNQLELLGQVPIFHGDEDSLDDN